MSGKGTVRVDGDGRGAGGFTADRPTETPDTPESAALYAALERIFATAPAARGVLLADAVGAATAHLAHLAVDPREVLGGAFAQAPSTSSACISAIPSRRLRAWR